MWLSADAITTSAWGNGPTSKFDESEFLRQIRLVDCTQALDYFLLVPLDASHQYYRRSPAVPGGYRRRALKIILACRAA